MSLNIDPQLLSPIVPMTRTDWTIWEKKNLNIHRAMVELQAQPSISARELATDIRQGVKEEFRPSWWRGFGFGTVIHFSELPPDLNDFGQNIDSHGKSSGVWQWAILCFNEKKVVVTIHNWLPGYLSPVYNSILGQLRMEGYECHVAEKRNDNVFFKLMNQKLF